MKAYLQCVTSDTVQNAATTYAGIYYMSGTPPVDKATLDAAVDLKSAADVHAKAVGFGFLQSQNSYSSTGVGKLSSLFSAMSDKMSWMKKASVPIVSNSVSYYYQVPDMAYREDGFADLWHLPPGVMSFPNMDINVWQGATYKNLVASSFKHKENPAVLGVVALIMEFDNNTTVSGILNGNNDAYASSDWMYYTKVEYWSGGAWQTCLANVYHPTKTVMPFTAVTAKKFRITLTPYSNYATINACKLGGYMLTHTAANSAVSLPDITWGIIVPLNKTTFSTAYGLSDSSSTSSIVPDINLRTYSYNKAVNYLVTEANYLPAIIDTAGLDASASKMSISKASALTSADRPTLLSYKYNLGDLS